MTEDISIQLEEIRRLCRAGFMRQARIRSMELLKRPGALWPPNSGLSHECTLLSIESKAGLFGESDDSEIESFLRSFDGSQFGSSLHALALYSLSRVGSAAEAQLRLLDALLDDSDLASEDDRMKCVRLQRRLDRALPSDAAWLESVRTGAVEFDGHATFEVWERRVLTGEHAPAPHWCSAAHSVIEFLMSAAVQDIGGITEEVDWGLLPQGRTVVAEYSRRQVALAAVLLGECPKVDVGRLFAHLDDASECIAWIRNCAPRWEHWFGVNSVEFAALVVLTVRLLRYLSVVVDGEPDLPAEVLAMHEKALAICRGAAADRAPDAVEVLNRTAQWNTDVERAIAARAQAERGRQATVVTADFPSDPKLAAERAEQAAKQASLQDAKNGLEPWDAEKFWAAVGTRAINADAFGKHLRIALLVRGLESIWAREDWPQLSIWHQRASALRFRHVANEHEAKRLRELALKFIESGRFGSGLALLSLSQREDDLFAPVNAAEEKAQTCDDELASLLQRMREAVGREGSVESADEFANATRNFHGSQFAEGGHGSRVFQLGTEMLDRTAQMAPADHARYLRSLFGSVAATAWGDRLAAVRQSLAAVIDQDTAAALEAFRFERFVENRASPQVSLSCDVTYRTRLVEKLRTMPDKRREILRCLEWHAYNPKSDVAWIELLQQLMQWQSDAGVPLWGQKQPPTDSASEPANGLLDLTRESSEEEVENDDRGPERSVAHTLFNALLASKEGQVSKVQGWQAVPQHGGSWNPPAPARELFDAFLKGVSQQSHGSLWQTIVFHRELPVEYRIEALRAWIDRAGTPEAHASTPTWPRSGWWPTSDLGDVLIRDLLECGHFAEARERSKNLLGDQNRADASPRLPSALFAVLAACENEDQRLAWLRWYADHWRKWLPKYESIRGSDGETSDVRAGDTNSSDLLHAAHGLAFVGFELLRRARASKPHSSSMHFEGLDCIVRADLAFVLSSELGVYDDQCILQNRWGPSSEVAAWSKSSGDNPHRVSRLVFRGLIKELAPGTLEWGCAIGLALHFARSHKDRTLQMELLALLESREAEVDAVMQRDHAQRLIRAEQEFKEHLSGQRGARTQNVGSDAAERAWQTRRDQIKPPPSLRSDIERWRTRINSA